MLKWNEKDEHLFPGKHGAEPKFGEGIPIHVQAEPQEAWMC